MGEPFELQPGDTLIVRADRSLTVEEAIGIRDAFRFHGIAVLLLEPVGLTVIGLQRGRSITEDPK